MATRPLPTLAYNVQVTDAAGVVLETASSNTAGAVVSVSGNNGTVAWGPVSVTMPAQPGTVSEVIATRSAH